MQHHDPQRPHPEHPTTREVARPEDDRREQPRRQAASLHDVPSGQTPGTTRKYYEF